MPNSLRRIPGKLRPVARRPVVDRILLQQAEELARGRGNPTPFQEFALRGMSAARAKAKIAKRLGSGISPYRAMVNQFHPVKRAMRRLAARPRRR